MTYIIKKTNDLLEDEKLQICELFYDVFDNKKSVDDFSKQFLGTITGYSYHGLMIENDKIVGCYSAMPFEYNFYSKKYIFALSVDTMIMKEYRGNPFSLKKMANLVYKSLTVDGIPFVFGFPNDNVYLIRKKILKWQDVGQLDYYMLPIRIGNIKKELSILNPISSLISKCMVLPISNKLDLSDVKFNIGKNNNEEFKNYRYS